KARTAAVFALYRINTADALDAARSGLSDESASVQTAAARVAGLARDEQAVEKLEELIQPGQDRGVRRQAATALGQIGDPRAVESLLNAADGVKDRFLEHAIIYALITMGHPEPLIKALESESDQIRKAALIALDQMNDSPL